MGLEATMGNQPEGTVMERRAWAWGAAPAARALDLQPIMSAQYYECRLGADQGQVDYLVAFSRGAAAPLRERLSVFGSGDGPAPERWSALQRLAVAWADGRSLVSVQSPTFWLEFDDHVGAEASSAMPSVSVCLVPGYQATRPLASGQNARDLATAADALDHLQLEDHGKNGALAEELQTCFDQLPDGARWIHLSVMLGRNPCAVKLYGVFPRSQLLPYLQRIGWAGDALAIEAIMKDVYAPSLVGDQVFVDLNLDTLRDPQRCTLGLAVAQQHLAWVPCSEPDRRGILQRWLGAGLCTAKQATDVSSWVNAASQGGYDAAAADPLLMPFLDIKLVWQTGKRLLAKAYLGCHRQGGPF
jgi:hypothetical protein